MPSFIRNPKEFWSGAMFLAFGLAAVLIARDYSMGTAGRMGPAYFPTVLGGILGVIGLIAIVRSFFSDGDAVEKFAFRELILILVSVILFGVLVRGAGMVIAIPVIILMSAYASKKFHLGSSIALAIGATIFSVLLFVKALGLPMPVLGTWFGF
ncbi:tripartite tricarboxylate transporter TctB family protein [Noviherbaspirillum cavernae]|uniref:Tripartite tricarboxylate transporter TctB family protein n=1 Tax=Noviherbaspirillum cavernae TaxID=2320862 RepID=A0A418X3H8_9BURK|nr:tripartite tricarboxylate transporter TctB family protein [Noviherbaspirillum cavernae]RJG07022.1 tripartite tricarboxylate transporter TctB family protein [Noviherbaspirillum cavernae]